MNAANAYSIHKYYAQCDECDAYTFWVSLAIVQHKYRGYHHPSGCY